jgi:hypothetical protein
MSCLDRILYAGLLLLVPCTMVAQELESNALALDDELAHVLGECTDGAAPPE